MENSKQKIRIVICDDMPFIAESFRKTLEKYEDLEVVAIATSGKSCIEAVSKYDPDILLLDIQMSIYNEGIITLEKIKQTDSHVKIIMCTIHNEDDFILKSFVLGANGYLIKTEPEEVIVNTIRSVYKDNVSLSADIAQRILKSSFSAQAEKQDISKLLDTVATLTHTEYEILKSIYYGYTYKTIAQERFVEESTIRSQVNKILKKFDFKTMKQLVKHLKSLNIFE